MTHRQQREYLDIKYCTGKAIDISKNVLAVSSMLMHQ